MIQRLAISLTIAVLLFAAREAQSQEGAKSDPGVAMAFELFHQGKLRQAADKLRSVIARTEDPGGKVFLERSLIEICATGYDWNCVTRVLNEALPRLAADPKLGILRPDFLLYGTKLALWHGNYPLVDQLVQKGGAYSAAAPIPHAALFSELALTLHGYHLKKMEASTAERLRSAAILGLLLTEPKNNYSIAKVLVDLIEAMTDARDIAGAFTLAGDAEGYLARTLNRGSALFARYRNLVATLLSYTNLHAATVSNFMEAVQLFEQLDTDDGVKQYSIGIANNLAVAALLLDSKLDEATALHSRHPLQKQKDAVLERGDFQSYTDFFFGVADVFLSIVAGKPPDPRWRKLFEKEPQWQLAEIEKNDIESYRNFALGLISLSEKALPEGQRLVLLGARQRIENFERFLEANFEGFPLPGLVDRIVISAGLTAAVKTGGKESLDLMLRGSDVLGRNLRHQLVDVAALLAALPDIASRREAHAYLHLLASKRDWEFDRIRKLMADPSVLNKGAIMTRYSEAMTTISSLKEKLRSRKPLMPPVSASLERMQRSLADGQAYVGYFPFIGGVGRICVTRGDAVFATSEVTPEVLNDVRTLTGAVTVFPKDAEEAGQFPAPAAVRVYRFMFAGLEQCLVPGTHAIVALPPEFAGVPLGALLRGEPPRRGNGFDLREASWLIRDISFSTVISARHHLATVASANRRTAARPFLGIGDPTLVGDRAIKIAAADGVRGSGKAEARVLDFVPLPETADEIRAAAKLFGAADADMLLGLRGTEEAFRARPLSDYDVLHFATHGLVKDDVAGLTGSALVVTPGDAKDRFDDGLLSAAEISRLSLNARLVILSACNTAKYDVAQASRGVQDLQAAFAVAGAPTLLASLWPVDSLATKDVIARFLNEWRGQDSKGAADALARAMRGFLARSDALRQHPAFWAPFVVVGNGGVVGTSSAEREARPPTFEFLPGFSSYGEIFHAVRAGPDVIFSMIGEWDGSKMNGIVTRRSVDGAEKWRVGSREFGSGKLAISGDTLYTIGYTTAVDYHIPVVRSLTTGGRMRWKIELPDLPNHMLGDVVSSSKGAIVAAAPHFGPPDSDQHVWVLSLGKDGKVRTKARMPRPATGSNIGHSVLISPWNGRLVAVSNLGRSRKLRPEKRTLTGVPTICMEGSTAAVDVLDPETLRVISSTAIPDFSANALATLNGALFIAGEVQDTCSLGGVASVFRLDKSGIPRPLWKDDDLFGTSVRGMTISDGQLVLVVNHERTLGMAPDDPKPVDDYSYKHVLEELATAREASLVRVSADGALLGREYMAGGLSVSVQGVLRAGKGLLAYGTMGGLPAYTPASRNQAKVLAKRPLPQTRPGGWQTKVIVNQ